MSITVLPKSVLEERNDDNNKDDDPDVQGHVFCHLKSDNNHNKEMVLKNAASYRPDWSKQRNLDFKINNAPTYCNDIMQYLFILICCQLFCRQQQATSRTTTYQYTFCLMVAVSVHFNTTITLTFTIAIQQWWKELCNTTVQYWREAFYTLIYCYLKKPSNGGVQPGKKLLTTTCGCYQSLHSIRSPAVMLQCCVLSHSSLNRVSFLPFTDYKSLDHVFDYGTPCITMFANWLSDVLLLHEAPTRLSPMLSLDLLPCSHNRLSDVIMYLPYDAPMKLSPMLALGLFPCSHDRLHQIKSYSSGAGRQASDRSGGNGKRTQSESSKQSGSAGSNTNSSTARGACYTVRTGLGGVSGGTGDSSGGDDEDDKDWRWYLERPWDVVWEENGDEDDNENCSADAASKDTPGENKGGKEPHVTAESTVYEFSLKCGDYLYMFGVTSEMKYKPLPGDKLENLCAAKRSVTTTECSYEVYELYTYHSSGNICLRLFSRKNYLLCYIFVGRSRLYP